MESGYNAIVLSTIVFLAGGAICVFVGKRLGITELLSTSLFVWHAMWSFVYSNYVLTFGGDPWIYYQRARFDAVEPAFGTDFVVWVTSFPVSLGFSYWPIAFLYNFIGGLALTIFAATLREILTTAPVRSSVGTALFFICIFLPSISFWTSGIGKDGFAFLAVSLFVWSCLQFDRRRLAMIGGILIVLPVRPHVAAAMIMSVSLGALWVKSLRPAVRTGMAVAASVAALFAIPLVLTYSGASKFGSLGEFVTDRQGQNQGGGSSIDISGMNPVERFLTFLYRPLPNETSGVGQLAASIDNVILIFLTALAIVAIFRAGIREVLRSYSIAMIYGFTCAVMLSQVTANLGLASRQKWMAIPSLMVVLVGAWHMRRPETARDKLRLQMSGAGRIR